MQISDEMVEKAARRMAVADGKNPDKLSHNSFEWWRHYVPMARAVLEPALSAAEPVKTPSVAEEIADAVLSWMVRYDLLDADNEYHAADVLAVLNDLTPACHSRNVDSLKWVDHPNSYPAPTWSAQTPFGFYNIEEISASDSPAYEVRLHAHKLISVVDGLPEAKAAAQSDYEARIRSALSAQVQDVAVAEIVSAHGDPEAFGERELVALVDIQKFPYRTKLYAAAPAKQEGT